MADLQRYISGLRHNGLIWILVPGVFFCWGFTSTSVDMVIPRIKSMFDLSYTSALLIQFSFFLAYLFIPIPAGKFIQHYGYRQSLFIGLACTALGVLLLAPSVMLQLYPAFLGGIFIAASGIAVLQVTANPMILALGDPLTAPRRLSKGNQHLATSQSWQKCPSKPPRVLFVRNLMSAPRPGLPSKLR